MNTSILSATSTTTAVLQSYTKQGFNITISTPDITETERQKTDILIKGKLTDLLNRSKQ